MSFIKYTRFDGAASRYPLDKITATTRRTNKYDVNDGPACSACVPFQSMTREAHIRFTKNDHCSLCADMDAFDLFNMLNHLELEVGDNVVLPTVVGGRITATYRNASLGRELSSETLAMYREAVVVLYGESCNVDCLPSPPSSPSEATERGFKHYLRPQCCRDCGSVGLRITDDSKCYFCESEKRAPSPRQQAIANGDTWYTPNEPCTKCGEIAERRVNDGKCKGCKPAVDSRATPDSIMMEESPNLVVAREDARSFGFKVYRTGEACNKGHTGFRYVSTGNCIECIKKGR